MLLIYFDIFVIIMIKYFYDNFKITDLISFLIIENFKYFKKQAD